MGIIAIILGAIILFFVGVGMGMLRAEKIAVARGFFEHNGKLYTVKDSGYFR